MHVWAAPGIRVVGLLLCSTGNPGPVTALNYCTFLVIFWIRSFTQRTKILHEVTLYPTHNNFGTGLHAAPAQQLFGVYNIEERDLWLTFTARISQTVYKRKSIVTPGFDYFLKMCETNVQLTKLKTYIGWYSFVLHLQEDRLTLQDFIAFGKSIQCGFSKITQSIL